MVSQTDVCSRLKKYGEQKPSDPGAVGQGNTVYCQTSPLYVDDKESAAATLVSLAQEARLATEDVKAPTSNAILTVCKSLIAGGVAAGVSRSAVATLERLKILLQVQNPLNPKYSGTMQGLKLIWKNEGIPGFFKGNGTNCA
jgi:solute carrier family 25 phosphate transporter 23/24/25/41